MQVKIVLELENVIQISGSQWPEPVTVMQGGHFYTKLDRILTVQILTLAHCYEHRYKKN